MIVISIECSHKRGMGHFYRALNIRQYLGAAGEGAVIVLNDDKGLFKYWKVFQSFMKSLIIQILQLIGKRRLSASMGQMSGCRISFPQG